MSLVPPGKCSDSNLVHQGRFLQHSFYYIIHIRPPTQTYIVDKTSIIKLRNRKDGDDELRLENDLKRDARIYYTITPKISVDISCASFEIRTGFLPSKSGALPLHRSARLSSKTNYRALPQLQ
jgi:hypothetical protein